MPRFIIWLCEMVACAMQTFVPFSFCSHVIGFAEQSGAGNGGVGLQQSITGGAPQGTSCASADGTPAIEALKV